LALGETIAATILPKGDSDWYRVDVDEQGELRLSITEVPKDLDVVFRVWNAEHQSMTSWFAPLRAGGETEGSVDLPAAGSYVIEVRDGNNNARSIIPYALRLAFTPTKDRAEPNNTFGTSTPLKLGASLWATILPRGDVDWYRISTHRPGDMTILINESPPNLDMVVRVWNADKQAISNWLAPRTKGGDTEGRVPLPKAGEYFLEVRDSRNDERSVESYRLNASM
jgi:hypothetical protein